MSWNIAIARYSKSINQVAERRVKTGLDWRQAENYICKNQLRPIYAYAEGAVELYNPELAMINTNAYKAEYKKIID